MRYSLPTDKLVNRLVPHYLSGRKFILLLQSLVYPLSMLNDRFVLFAKEKIIEANMTSQAIYFDWYINRKFNCYFKESTERIVFTENESLGVDIYPEGALFSRPYTVWYENEEILTTDPEEYPKELFLLAENIALNRINFIVHVPEITIPAQEFVYMLSYTINRYKLAGVTYIIKINKEEFETNNKAYL